MHRRTFIAAALASMSTTALASEKITYSYDARGRLVTVAHSGDVNGGVVTSYALDKADNRISMTVKGSGSSTPASPPATAPAPAPASGPTPTKPPPSGTTVPSCIVVVPLGGTLRLILCGRVT